MAHNLEDRRTRRSRRLLGDALLELLEHHPLDTIKVRQVTEHADIGYMTFYRHFDSLDDLLVDRVKTLLDEEISQVLMDCEQQSTLILAHVTRHLALYRALLFSPGAALARRKLEAILADIYTEVPLDNEMPPELPGRMRAAAALTLVEWWLEGGMTVPQAQMVALYDTFVLARSRAMTA
jgi:AcrR family transcriptional regulator